MLNIMIVDDAMIMRNMLRKKLEELGHKVIAEAPNGEEAVKMYPNIKPDLVTMDITMDEMDGIETLKNIMKIDSSAKVMMITSHGEQNRVIEAIQAGAKGYVLKPISKDGVKESIDKIFNNL